MNMHAPPTRRGYTLFEVLLVVVLLAVLAGLTTPTLARYFGTSTLKSSAAAVADDLAAARRYAVDTGLTYQFRFEPNGRNWVVVPYERPAAAPDGTAATFPVSAGTLPEGVMLAPRQGEMASGGPLDPKLFVGLPNATALSQVTFAAPLLFYADGTADDAVVRVRDDERQSMTLSVRGVTGSPSVSGVTREPLL